MDKYYTNHEVTVPATELAVRLEDARQHLRMDDLRHDDLYIETLIKSASKYAEETFDYALLTQTVVEKHSRFPDTYTTPMYLTVIPAATVTSVTYIDCDGNTQTWASSEYEYYLKGKQPFIIPKPDYTYPTDLAMRPDAVTITYTAGNGSGASSVPTDVKLGLLAKIGRAYINREDGVEMKWSMSDNLFKSIMRI